MSPQEEEQEHQHILQEVLDKPETTPKKRNYQTLIGLAIVLLLIIWFIPAYAFPQTIKAKHVPSIEDIPPLNTTTIQRPLSNNINDYVLQDDPNLKYIAARIVTQSCSKPEEHCYAQALFEFVRDNINYVNDPLGEYYETPQETLLAQSADCDGHAILLASLLQHVGIATRFAYKPNHVYVEAYLPKKGLFTPDYVFAWYALDPTCKHCRVGET